MNESKLIVLISYNDCLILIHIHVLHIHLSNIIQKLDLGKQLDLFNVPLPLLSFEMAGARARKYIPYH